MLSSTSCSEEEFIQNGKLTLSGVEYLLQFKRFNFFDNTSTVILFIITLPFIIPVAIFRLFLLFALFGSGLLLKKYFSVNLENYPTIIRIIYFLCLGLYVKSDDNLNSDPIIGSDSISNERSTVILSNHNSRFDAILLANLHQCDSTYLAAARRSFFAKLIINSGLCSRSMEDGIALDTKDGREEWRRRLNSAYRRPMLFFPEGRVVNKPDTIITFQNHLLQGNKVSIICNKISYKSYFLDHTQIEIPFFKPPYSGFQNKLLWDSIIEGLPFLISLVTVVHTDFIGRVELNGNESIEEIDDYFYSIYSGNGFNLVPIDQKLVKNIMQCLYI